MHRHAIFAIGAVVFCVLVLLNVGGYRYGVSDQAFYVPLVWQSLEPDLFPHDAPLLAAQDTLFAFDDWCAALVRWTGSSIPVAFAVGYVITLGLLYVAALGVGGAFCQTRWGLAAFILALTLRHRIPDTAVNTFESYFHPRVLAFAVGLGAVALFLRGRTWLALAGTGAAFLIHPTTALWFGILLGVAALVADRDSRRPLLVAAAVTAVAAVWFLTGPLRAQLAVMDATWVGVLTSKDYLLPTDWPLTTWVANLGLAAVVGGIYLHRRALGLVVATERGLVAGCAALVGLFLISVPLASSHVALAVQLQVSRIFWLVDIFAMAYVAWLAVECPTRTSMVPGWPRPRHAVVALVAVAAIARGGYVTLVEKADDPLVRTTLPADDWTEVMAWAADRPVGTHFLTDPDHAWRYGSSVRVASRRDVYLEEIKDIGIAIYSDKVAYRVARRIEDLGTFATLDAGRARTLAARYDIDYLITEHPVDLPLVHRAGRFRVYDLGVTTVARVDALANRSD